VKANKPRSGRTEVRPEGAPKGSNGQDAQSGPVEIRPVPPAEPGTLGGPEAPAKGAQSLQTSAGVKRALALKAGAGPQAATVGRLHCPNQPCQSPTIVRIEGEPPPGVGIVLQREHKSAKAYKGPHPGAWCQCRRCGLFFPIERATMLRVPIKVEVVRRKTGIECPGNSCDSTKSRVVFTRQKKGKQLRERECLRCGRRWKTEESSAPGDLE